MTAALHAAALAALEARRALIEAATPGPWQTWPEHDGGVWAKDGYGMAATGCGDGNGALIVAMHADYSRSLDALEQVLVRHEPRQAGSKGPFCFRCHRVTIARAPEWPCPDARSVLAALGLEA